ncbi:MAG: TIGR00282 family metallophosphoesterase [Spiroplasma sp.]
MKFLIIGDIYGSVGRQMVSQWIPEVKNYLNKQNQTLDFIIANGENITHGKSISLAHYEELKKLGVDVITSGNHIFSPTTNVVNYIKNHKDLLRPLNYNPYQPGTGTILVNKNNKKIRVTNLIGRTFMDHSENPYFVLEELLQKEKSSDIHIIDFHGEATAEKLAFAWYFDGKITCIVGTHTHVQTADNRLLPKGSAFISDIGMTGPYDSIIGANPEEVIYRERTALPVKFQPANGKGQFCAVILTVDDKTNKAVKLERVFITPDNRKIVLY